MAEKTAIMDLPNIYPAQMRPIDVEALTGTRETGRLEELRDFGVIAMWPSMTGFDGWFSADFGVFVRQ